MGPWQNYMLAQHLAGRPGPPVRSPVTVADIQRRLGETPRPFADDLNSRSRADMGDLNAAIARVKADPGRLMNGPDLLGAVARFVPNAFGLAPAAAVDQVTGPEVRTINANFGTHFNHQPVTDQLLNAVGLIAGGAERPLPQPASDPLNAVPRYLTVVPDDEFVARHSLQEARLSKMSPENQRQFDQNAREPVIGPYLEDPDFPGHGGAGLARIRSTLSGLADHYRPQGPNGVMMADEIGDLSDNLMSLAARQYPEFAEALGGPRPWNPLGPAFRDAGGPTPDQQVSANLPPGMALNAANGKFLFPPALQAPWWAPSPGSDVSGGGSDSNAFTGTPPTGPSSPDR